MQDENSGVKTPDRHRTRAAVSLARMLVLGAASCIFSSHAMADDFAGGRKIVDIGCHNDASGVCFLTPDGAPFGTGIAACPTPTNEFRFENANTDQGKRSYASLLAAYVAQKHVSVYLNGCTGQGFPALVYFHVID
jgi:hypothetical protein